MTRDRSAGEGFLFGLVRSAANLYAAPAAGFFLCAILAAWRIRGPIGPIALVFVTLWASQWRRRVPSGARQWSPETDGELPDYFADIPKMKIRVLVVPGANSSASVRGTLAEPAVVITNRTYATWMTDRRARDIQYAHECAHVGLGDSWTYYFLTSATVVSSVYFAFLYRSSMSLLIVVGVLAVVVASLRGYQRVREHAADIIGGGMIPGAAEEMARHEVLDPPRIGPFALHPSMDDRLIVLEDPLRVLDRSPVVLVALGAAAIPISVQVYLLWEHLWNDALAPAMGFIGAAVFVGAPAARALSFQASRMNIGGVRAWLRRIAIGQLGLLALLAFPNLGLKTLALLILIALAAIWIAAPIARGIALAFTVLAGVTHAGVSSSHWLRLGLLLNTVVIGLVWLAPVVAWHLGLVH